MTNTLTPTSPDSIAEALAEHGHVQAFASHISISGDEWRKNARRAGRVLKRPVRTVQGGNILIAELHDWPANAEEAAKDEQQLRSAMMPTYDAEMLARIIGE